MINSPFSKTMIYFKREEDVLTTFLIVELLIFTDSLSIVNELFTFAK